MSLFGRNPNETDYTGGKKHWADVIKNSGSAEFLIWRQPEEDFNTNSTLIVMPGEEAIFIKGGSIEKAAKSSGYPADSWDCLLYFMYYRALPADDSYDEEHGAGT